ncbi:transcriptional regulator, IclR family [Pseudonocardia ammonioxydans]|uniref:Transcriptional regulator, IclR family n=1 Tax=Pseudonocardia ammonioxydans TaxID=260086 RepID=A0A1I5H2U7_PSUAM|nr:IclR family transcriptional regulator [Pseudonocardia ammonioxydans]SFO42582.1 transcriptional regulator, IclR family [Pseudonocardia ammonioxydans]
MKNKPAYSIESVDHALRLAVLLQQEGPLGVTEAARRLDVARSTAHRLLAMLVYRDFAVQGTDRRYAAGAVLGPAARVEPVAELRRAALPHLRALVERTGETANVMVLLGTQIRMVATVECDQALRVGDREGRLLPAHLASGGRALLARLPRDELDARYDGGEPDGVTREQVERVVRQTRRRGVALNDGGTETGLTAVGFPIGAPGREPAAALSVAMPTARYHRRLLPELVAALADAAGAVDRDLRAAAGTTPGAAAENSVQQNELSSGRRRASR